MVKNCRDLSYVKRLEKLSLLSLARQRLGGDLMVAHNMSDGFFDFTIEEFFTRLLCSFTDVSG